MEQRAEPENPGAVEESRLSRLRPYLGGILLGLAVAAFAILIAREVALAPPPVEIQLPESGPAPSSVTVHVGGAVTTSGVYALPLNSRVIDAIGMAGGLTENADTDAANMAEELEDGSSYIVPIYEGLAHETDTVVVYLTGTVQQVGLYSLPAGSRVSDAVNAAGGLTELADLSEINFAATLVDGERYDMPSQGKSDSAAVFVHLVGAIEQPGTYTLANGARLVDVVEMAGGPTEGADTDAVDLALRLQDGERYYVPFRGEQSVGDVTVHIAGAVAMPGLHMLPTGTRLIDAIMAAGGVLSTADVHALNLAQTIEDGARYAVPNVRTTVNVNLAGVDELDGVPGISRTVALAIVDQRDVAGAFIDIDQLLDVSGIGPATLAAIRPFVSVS